MHWSIENFKKNNKDVIPHIVTSNIEHCATELPLKQWKIENKIGNFLLNLYSKSFFIQFFIDFSI